MEGNYKKWLNRINVKLDKGDYTGNAQDLKDEINNKANISHIHDISSITNLQNSLDTITNDINNLEGENVAQYDLINDLNSELESERTRNDIQDNLLENLEGIHYTWSPTNRTLTLFDRGGTQLSQVSLVSLDNEGTDLRYNASTLSLELYNADNELLDSIPVSSFIGSVGTQLQLNSNQLQLKDSQGNILSTVSFSVSNIEGLQTTLDGKLDKGTYTGTASDLFLNYENLTQSLQNEQSVRYYADQGLESSKQNKLETVSGNIGVGKTDASATEKLDVSGNVKAIDFKGQSVKFTLQTSIPPTPNTLVPKTDGSGLVWYDSNSILRNIGENFFSADLSSTTARNHSMNASFTIDTKGNAYSIKNLPNKNTDIANFRKVRVQNTSGLDSVVDSKNLLTDGVTSMSDAEKDAWRISQRKTNETYSIGSPQVDAILPPVINGNETFNQFITVVGLNLFVNNSTPSTANLEIRRVKDINGNTLSTPDVYTGLNIEVSQNNPTILTTSINFSTMPKGYYKAFVTHNGLTNLTSPEFFVGNVITPIVLPSPFWTVQLENQANSINYTEISSIESNLNIKYYSEIFTNSTLLESGFIAELTCVNTTPTTTLTGGRYVGGYSFGIIGEDNVVYGIRVSNSTINSYSRTSVFLPSNEFMNSSVVNTNKIYVIYKNNIVTIINQTTGRVKSFIDSAFKSSGKRAYFEVEPTTGGTNEVRLIFNNVKSF